MSILRSLARPLLGAVFVSGGIDTLRQPKSRVAKAEAVAPQLADTLGLRKDTEQLVKFNAAVQVGAGALLSMGKLPRLAALALCASIVPTTIAGHRFWEEDEPATRAQQRVHFLKNLGLLGGLILAALDTGGAPSLSWRAHRAARRASEQVQHVADVVSSPIRAA